MDDLTPRAPLSKGPFLGVLFTIDRQMTKDEKGHM